MPSLRDDSFVSMRDNDKNKLKNENGPEFVQKLRPRTRENIRNAALIHRNVQTAGTTVINHKRAYRNQI
jgi:hypothetical protein